MLYKKRVIIMLLVLITGTILSGFSLMDKTTVAIDTEQNKIYKYVSVDVVNAAFEKDEKEAVVEYKNKYYLLSGRVESIKKKGDGITICGSKEGTDVECSCVKDVRENILKYAPGDDVALFGMMKVDSIDKERHLEVFKIIEVPKDIKSSETYFTIDGTSYDYSKSISKNLSNNRIEYRIPNNWEEVELNIEENGLGVIEGYQYVLNKIPGNESVNPESLFVCYFDKSLLNNESDIDNIKAVEKTIINDIDGKVNKFPAKTSTTYYGQKYKYYIGKYTDKMDAGYGYRTEYVFVDDGKNGVVMFLYVYREPKYIDDVMFVARFLKINS